MENLRFTNAATIYSVELNIIENNIVKLTFSKGEKPSNVNCGFELVNENNGEVQGLYHDYATVYRTYENEPDIIELSNDGSVYEPTIPTVNFYCGHGGNIEGNIEQTVKNYETLVIPTAVADENYKFVGWNPEIPVSGVIESDTTYYAMFEYVETLDDIKRAKISELSLACETAIENGVDIDINGTVEHFSYKKNEDQNNIKELFDTAIQTNTPLYYHCDNGTCKLYTVEQIINLYALQALNKTINITYHNQLKGYVKSLADKDSVKEVVYGETELSDESKSICEAAIAQSRAAINTLLSNIGIKLTNEF